MIFITTASKKNISSKKPSDIFCHPCEYTFRLFNQEMNATRQNIILLICFMLISLWMYAVTSKLMDFNMFSVQMHRQLLFPILKDTLPYLLPATELLATILLAFSSTRFSGLLLSFFMLLAFTVYIGFAMSRLMGKIPCSCGGILNKMSWGTHLFFNLFVLLFTACGIYLVYRGRRTQNQR